MVTKLYTIQLPAAETNFVPDTCASTSQSKTPHTFGNVQVPRAGSLHRDIFGVSCWGLGPDDYELVTHFSTFRPVPCSVRFHINSVKRERESRNSRGKAPSLQICAPSIDCPRFVIPPLGVRWSHPHTRTQVHHRLLVSFSVVCWFLVSSVVVRDLDAFLIVLWWYHKYSSRPRVQ
jgi:hypothetical protein